MPTSWCVCGAGVLSSSTPSGSSSLASRISGDCEAWIMAMPRLIRGTKGDQHGCDCCVSDRFRSLPSNLLSANWFSTTYLNPPQKRGIGFHNHCKWFYPIIQDARRSRLSYDVLVRCVRCQFGKECLSLSASAESVHSDVVKRTKLIDDNRARPCWEHAHGLLHLC